MPEGYLSLNNNYMT